MANQPNDDPRPIAVFDSGVGGLSVLRELQAQLPNEDFIFFADQAYVPYGMRPLQQVRDFSEAITQYLLAQDAKMIVIACNTASAAALSYLREAFPQTHFVGMEPAVKPAAETTASGVVGVLATYATFQGELYASVIDRFAQDVRVLQSTCLGLVSEIEAGRLYEGTAEKILRAALQPMLAEGIDRVVLGCTHYPFAIPIIEEIVGAQALVIDPAPAIALQTARMIGELGLAAPADQIGKTLYLTSGDIDSYRRLIDSLLGIKVEVEYIKSVSAHAE